MIGAKKTGPKASTMLEVLERLKQGMVRELTLGVGKGAGGEINWNAIKAAKEFKAHQTVEVEKYRALLRRY